MPRNSSVNGDERRVDTYFQYDISQAGGFTSNFGRGIDVVALLGNGTVPQVRLTFTSSEVGNGNPNDGTDTGNQDGGLAVRIQAEGADGALTGAISRVDDEGISFVNDGTFTFDVRDLTNGAARGDAFNIVRLGTSRGDLFIEEAGTTNNIYINAGMGNDNVTSSDGNDFLVGGAGDDQLDAGVGADTFIGGAGADRISGGQGEDASIFNVSLDGADAVNLGGDSDQVRVNAGVDVTQVRLTFTSSEVGNGDAADSNTQAGQDGLLAVRMQAEDGEGGLTGDVSRYDDEGISFFADANFTFDVRDLVSGAERGDGFGVVRLGTDASEVYDDSLATRDTYTNMGAGDDILNSGSGSDYLVGGSGDDQITAGAGDDTVVGGAGDDRISGGDGNDTAVINSSSDGMDAINLGAGADSVKVSSGEGVTQVRLTFTSAEVGNGDAADSDTLANQDGRLAVRVQEETGGALTGAVSRVDDEGITFTAAEGVTFDVRDLVSGTARGNYFSIVSLGTSGADSYDGTGQTVSYYINGGAGNDTITGSDVKDFLVGGMGDDVLTGGGGKDTLLGGAGADIFAYSDNTAGGKILDFATGEDKIDLSEFGIDASNIDIVSGRNKTVVSVDTNEDGTFDFKITLDGATAVASDFVF